MPDRPTTISPIPGLAALKDVTPPPSLVPAVMQRIAEPAPVTLLELAAAAAPARAAALAAGRAVRARRRRAGGVRRGAGSRHARAGGRRCRHRPGAAVADRRSQRGGAGALRPRRQGREEGGGGRRLQRLERRRRPCWSTPTARGPSSPRCPLRRAPTRIHVPGRRPVDDRPRRRRGPPRRLRPHQRHPCDSRPPAKARRAAISRYDPGPVPRVRGLAFLILLPLLWLAIRLGAAPAMRATGEIDVAGGHDDNMLLATAPDAPTSLNRLGGWFGQAAPSLTLGLGGAGFRLEASYAGDYRYADEVGQLYFQEGELTAMLSGAGAGSPAAEPVRRLLRFLPLSRGPVPVRRGRGGPAGGVAGFAAPAGSLPGAVAAAGGRHHVHRPAARGGRAGCCTCRRPPVEVGPRASLLVVQPRAADGIRFVRWRGGVDGALDLGPLTVSAGAWVGALELGALFERHAGGNLEVRWPVSRNLALFAGGRAGRSDLSRRQPGLRPPDVHPGHHRQPDGRRGRRPRRRRRSTCARGWNRAGCACG